MWWDDCAGNIHGTSQKNKIVQAGKTSDAEIFVRELARRVPQHGGVLMTIAQQQVGRKDRAEGLQLGGQRGIEKEHSEGERSLP